MLKKSVCAKLKLVENPFFVTGVTFGKKRIFFMQQIVALEVFIRAPRPPSCLKVTDLKAVSGCQKTDWRSLKMFLDYIETDVVQDDYTKELDEAVVEIQNDERWRKSIMTVDQVIEDAAHAAAAEALLQGIEQGEAFSPCFFMS